MKKNKSPNVGQEFKPCPECKGSGKKDDKDCKNCRGKGKIPDWSKDYAPEDLKCVTCRKPFTIPNRLCRRSMPDACDDCLNHRWKLTEKGEWIER
jgi:RecJ-like exonuclease